MYVEVARLVLVLLLEVVLYIAQIIVIIYSIYLHLHDISRLLEVYYRLF